MDEATKDAIEGVGGALLEASVSMVPFIGGALAVIANRAVGAAAAQRTERILSEFRDALQEAVDNGRIGDTEILTSDEFLAAVHAAAAGAQQTASEEKRQMLRNALVNGTVAGWGSEEQEFLTLVTRYGPQHIHVLAETKAHMGGREGREHGVRKAVVDGVAPQSGDDWGRANRAFDQLTADGLISEAVTNIVEAPGHGRAQERSNSIGEVRPREAHSVAPRGDRFLHFIADGGGATY